MAPLVILCFHRVVDDDDPHAWPYLQRGTAIRRSTFEAQIRELRRLGSFVDPLNPLRQGFEHDNGSSSARFWLTFDDGYRDTIRIGLPILRRFDARASVFVTTEVALGRAALPADQWYSVLLSARRRSGTARAADWTMDADLDDSVGRQRLVMGAERRAFLEAAPSTRDAILEALESALDGDRAVREELYMNRADLEDLEREGWSVGGHGATHAILSTLNEQELKRELDHMLSGLDELRIGARSWLAWPDGQHTEAARGWARARGFRGALALGDEPVALTSDLMALPRFIVTDDPRWASSLGQRAIRKGVSP